MYAKTYFLKRFSTTNRRRVRLRVVQNTGAHIERLFEWLMAWPWMCVL